MVPLMALPAAAALLFMAVDAPNPYIAVAALASCFGAAELTEAPFWAAGMNIGRGDTMAVCGIMNTGGNLGGIISLPIIGYFSGRHSWHICFLIGAALAVVSAACWLWITIVPPAEVAEDTRPSTAESRAAHVRSLG
jgi:MFS transporter, ACS family, glucarate transporter